MHTGRAFTLVLSFVAALAGCTAGPANSGADSIGATAPAVNVAAEERAIRAATQRWASALRRGDSAATDTLYADDGVWLRAGSIPLLNRDSLRADFLGAAAADSGTQQQETIRVAVAASGDLAYELGRFFVRPGTSGPTGRGGSGFYVRVWQKQGGQWKLLATAPRAYAPDSTDGGRVRGR